MNPRSLLLKRLKILRERSGKLDLPPLALLPFLQADDLRLSMAMTCRMTCQKLSSKDEKGKY